MDLSLLANLAYIVSAALFIFGLKMLGSPATARRGNMLSALGMLVAGGWLFLTKVFPALNSIG